jgi:hypothetical protein
MLKTWALDRMVFLSVHLEAMMQCLLGHNQAEIQHPAEEDEKE